MYQQAEPKRRRNISVRHKTKGLLMQSLAVSVYGCDTGSFLTGKQLSEIYHIVCIYDAVLVKITVLPYLQLR